MRLGRLVPAPIPGMGSSGGVDGVVSPNIEAGIRREAEAGGFAVGSEEFELEVARGMEAVRQTASAQMEEAREMARRAQVQIEEWHEQTGFKLELMKMLECAVRMGTGILCGPKRVAHRRSVFRDGALVRVDGVVPESTAAMPWNCYPDPECGVDVQEGSHHWERSWIPRRDLQDLASDPNYDGDEVMAALREGPSQDDGRTSRDAQLGGGPSDVGGLDERSRFEIWYGFVDLPVEDLRGHSTLDGGDGDLDWGSGEVVSVEVHMVNDRIIRLEPSLSVYGGDRFPYSYFRLSPVTDSDGRPLPWGRGIPSLTSVPQRAYNGAYNRLIRNLGITALPMFEIDHKVVRPQSGKPEIKPGKIWNVESPAGNVGGLSGSRTAIRPIVVDPQAQHLLAWMQVNQQLFEDLTGLSGVVGSSAGRNAPDTVGGMQLAASNSDSAIRRIVRAFDEEVMGPIIRRYYEHLLLDPLVEDALKGDFEVRISGTSVLERSVKMDMLANVLNLSANPSYGIDPLRAAKEMLSQAGIDSERLMFTDEQVQEMRKAAEEEASRASDAERVAMIKAESDLALAKIRSDMEMERESTKIRIEENREERDLQGKASDEWKALVGAVGEDEKRREDRERHEEDRKVKLAVAAMDSRTRQNVEARRRIAELEKARMADDGGSE